MKIGNELLITDELYYFLCIITCFTYRKKEITFTYTCILLYIQVSCPITYYHNAWLLYHSLVNYTTTG